MYKINISSNYSYIYIFLTKVYKLSRLFILDISVKLVRISPYLRCCLRMFLVIHIPDQRASRDGGTELRSIVRGPGVAEHVSFAISQLQSWYTIPV